MDTISKDLLGTIRTEIDTALSAIAKRHGLTMRLGKITYAETSFTAKVEGALEGGSREADTFKALAHLYGMKAEHLGKSFAVSGVVYKLVGLAARERKQPFLCENVLSKKRYWLPESVVRPHFVPAGVKAE